MATANLPNGLQLRLDRSTPLSDEDVDANWLALRGGGMTYIPLNTNINTLVTPGRYYWTNGKPTGVGFPPDLANFGTLTVDTTPIGDPNQGSVLTYQKLESYTIARGSPVSTYTRRINGGNPTEWAASLVIDSPTKAPSINVGPVRVITNTAEFTMIWESALGRYVKVYDGLEEKEFTASSPEAGSWSGPTYVYHFYAEIIIGGGGGGGGGHATGVNETGAGGGGGGAGGKYTPRRFTHDFVTAGPMTYTIGSGGLGSVDGEPAGDGTSTSIKGMTAYGGTRGGMANSAYIHGGNAPGFGATPGTPYNGGVGGPGVLGYTTEGGMLVGGTPRNGANGNALNYGAGGGGGAGKGISTTYAGNGGNGVAGYIRIRY